MVQAVQALRYSGHLCILSLDYIVLRFLLPMNYHSMVGVEHHIVEMEAFYNNDLCILSLAHIDLCFRLPVKYRSMVGLEHHSHYNHNLLLSSFKSKV
jgi:hypothetical protein